MAFVPRCANAVAARAFYHALRQAGARRRPSRAYAGSMVVGWTLLAVGVPIGLFLSSGLILGFSVGVGAILALGPAALYLSASGWGAMLYRKSLDAEGWERDEEHPVRRRKRWVSPRPFLPVRYRLHSSTVAVGSRWLSLGGLTLECKDDRLTARSASVIVAELDLVPQG